MERVEYEFKLQREARMYRWPCILEIEKAKRAEKMMAMNAGLPRVL